MARKTMAEVMGFTSGGSDPQAYTKIVECQLDSFVLNDELPRIELPYQLGFTLIAIRQVMVEVEAAIWRFFFSDLSSQKCMKKIVVDVAKQSLLAEIESTFDSDEDYLPLVGTVSLTPTSNSYPICVRRLRLKLGSGRVGKSGGVTV